MENYHTNKIENDECLAKGICTISPELSYLHEIIKEYAKELAFYLLKLKELGINNEKIKENIINSLSSVIIGVNYSEDQFYKIVSILYSDLYQAKEMYTSVCSKNNLKPEFVKSLIKTPKTTNISDAIRQGEKIFALKNSKATTEQKNLYEIMFSVLKNICIQLVELRSLGVDNEDAYEALLLFLNAKSLHTSSTAELHEILQKIVKLDHTLLMRLDEAKKNAYGTITPTEISLSTRANKVILISGTNIKDLELLLEATKGKGVDVYTHGHMVIAHAFPKFKSYSHLVGHFGQGVEASLLDFAAFPGAVLTTRHSFQRLENLYRSRIFTTDVIAPKGVVTIKDNNYEPLIQSALSAKGFTKDLGKVPIKITLDEKKILEKIEEVAEKIEKGEIKHFFNIGISNNLKLQKDYFEKFFKLLGKDSFVLSLSYTNGKDNVLLVESDYGLPLFYKTLEILTRKISIAELDPIVLFARCELITISNILNLKYMGIKKIYFPDCSPNLVNPSIITSLREMFDLKKYTNPKDDLKNMLKD